MLAPRPQVTVGGNQLAPRIGQPQCRHVSLQRACFAVDRAQCGRPGLAIHRGQAMVTLKGLDGLPGGGIELAVGMDGLRRRPAITQRVQVVLQLFHRTATGAFLQHLRTTATVSMRSRLLQRHPDVRVTAFGGRCEIAAPHLQMRPVHRLFVAGVGVFIPGSDVGSGQPGIELPAVADRGGLVAQVLVITAALEHSFQIIQPAWQLVGRLGNQRDGLEALVFGNAAAMLFQHVHRNVRRVAYLRVVDVRVDPLLAFRRAGPGIDAVAGGRIDETDGRPFLPSIPMAQQVRTQIGAIVGERQAVCAGIGTGLVDHGIDVGLLARLQRAALCRAQRPRTALAEVDLDGAQRIAAVLGHRADGAPLRLMQALGDAGNGKMVRRPTAFGATADGKEHCTGGGIKIAGIDMGRHGSVPCPWRVTGRGQRWLSGPARAPAVRWRGWRTG